MMKLHPMGIERTTSCYEECAPLCYDRGPIKKKFALIHSQNDHTFAWRLENV